MVTFLVHYFLHLIFPAFVAWLVSAQHWKRLYLVLLATMLVDLDHLLANPVFDPNRCSINFHPMHTTYAIVVYVILLLPKITRIAALGLLMHMATDAIDCYLHN